MKNRNKDKKKSILQEDRTILKVYMSNKKVSNIRDKTDRTVRRNR